jgi:hypothetical protein
MKTKSLLLTAAATLGLTVASMAQNTTYCNASLSLDGIDDFGSLPNVFFANPNQKDFTIEFYLKPSQSQTQYAGIWGKTGFWSEINVELFVPGNIRFFYATSIGGNQYFTTNPVTFSPDVWEHYAIVGDGSNNQIRVYKNGVLGSVSSHGTPNWTLPNSDSKIGAVFQGWQAPNVQYFKGKIDDFRVSDIVRYTNNFNPPQNLVADLNTRVLYDFNSSNGNVVPDMSDNNNNLTLQNGAVLDPNDVPYGSVINTITLQPINQVTNVNDNAQFVVSSSAISPSFQWQTNFGIGYQNVTNAGQYSGATNDTLLVLNTTLNNNNQSFRCIINLGSCSDTSGAAILTVCGAITFQPENQTTTIGNNVQFNVNSAEQGASYQWQTNLGLGWQNIFNAGQYNGGTNDTLIVTNVTISNNGQAFRCLVFSGSCSDTSDIAVLTVNNHVGINESQHGYFFSVFPNPSQSEINVKSSAKLIGESYTIYDNMGRVVLSGQIKAENTMIQLENLTGGIYIFSVGEGMNQTFKLIKK